MFLLSTAPSIKQLGGGGGGGGGGGKDTIFLAESAIFYPYTLHGVFGKGYFLLLLFADTVSASNHTDLSVFCTDFKTKILKVYTKILKTEHQNEHNWSIIGKLLLKILKRL